MCAVAESIFWRIIRQQSAISETRNVMKCMEKKRNRHLWCLSKFYFYILSTECPLEKLLKWNKETWFVIELHILSSAEEELDGFNKSSRFPERSKKRENGAKWFTRMKGAFDFCRASAHSPLSVGGESGGVNWSEGILSTLRVDGKFERRM